MPLHPELFPNALPFLLLQIQFNIEIVFPGLGTFPNLISGLLFELQLPELQNWNCGGATIVAMFLLAVLTMVIGFIILAKDVVLIVGIQVVLPPASPPLMCTQLISRGLAL